jgi:hypothetical protein
MSMNYFNNEAAKIDNDDKIIASKQCITWAYIYVKKFIVNTYQTVFIIKHSS